MEYVLALVSLVLLWMVAGIIISLAYVAISVISLTRGMNAIERNRVFDWWSEEMGKRKINTWITNKISNEMFLIKWGLTWPEVIMVSNAAVKAVQEKTTDT